MKSFAYTITDPQGLHARPAGVLVKQANAVVPCTVTIEKDGKKADARKMFALMGLGIKSGDTVAVHVGGENEEQVAADLEAFMQENL